MWSAGRCAPEGSPAHARLMPVRVLIVDDQVAFREAARATIELIDGFEVCAEADTGERAVELLPNARPDLVLMDVHMPGIDGFLATRRIRELAGGDACPVIILLSTYEATDYAGLAMECGAGAYVSKSELDAELLLTIWLTGSRP